MASSVAELIIKNSVGNQLQYAQNPTKCFFGKSPTLAEVDAIYGENTSNAWLFPQLCDLSEYAGARDKMDDGKIKQLAAIISTAYPYLKLSELMLFFYRFKAGEYEQFYGVVDPMAITRSIKQFIVDRAAAIDKKTGEETRAKAEQRTKGAISREEYLEGLKSGKYKPYKPNR